VERIFWQWVSSINWKIVANALVKSRVSSFRQWVSHMNWKIMTNAQVLSIELSFWQRVSVINKILETSIELYLLGNGFPAGVAKAHLDGALGADGVAAVEDDGLLSV